MNENKSDEARVRAREAALQLAYAFTRTGYMAGSGGIEKLADLGSEAMLAFARSTDKPEEDAHCGLPIAPWLAEVFRRNGPCPTCGTLGMAGKLEDAGRSTDKPEGGGEAERLREALAPFVREWNEAGAGHLIDDMPWDAANGGEFSSLSVTVGDFRRAALALAAAPQEPSAGADLRGND